MIVIYYIIRLVLHMCDKVNMFFSAIVIHYLTIKSRNMPWSQLFWPILFWKGKFVKPEVHSDGMKNLMCLSILSIIRKDQYIK